MIWWSQQMKGAQPVITPSPPPIQGPDNKKKANIFGLKYTLECIIWDLRF